MWIMTNRYLVSMKDPSLASSPSTNTNRYTTVLWTLTNSFSPFTSPLNEPERQRIAKLTLTMGSLKELSSLCSGLQSFFWFQYKEHKVCLTKIPTYGIFKLLSVIYFQNM